MDDLDSLFGTGTVAPVTPEKKGILFKIPAPPPGIYHGIDADTYHAWDAMNSSFIKSFAANPYKARYMPFKGSKYTEIGHAAHGLTLEGIAPVKYVEEARGIDKSLREHPLSSIMLNRGFNEMSLVWVDPGTGMLCKARLDDYFNGGASDLKTCSDIERFKYDIYKFGYQLQSAHYASGVLANNLPLSLFYFIAAQTTPPYPVKVGYIEPGKLADAQCEVARLLGLIKECRESDYWPNFKIPHQVYSLSQVTPSDYLEEW